MIELYHGSNVEIAEVDLSQSRPDKDFGRGFYLTDIKQQALDMAFRRTNIVGMGSPSITTFLFDEKLLHDGSLNVLRFEKPSRDWAKFILANRSSRKTGFNHDYDIVIGPVADDGVVLQLDLFSDGLITIDELVRRLTYRHLNNQYFFGTPKAISFLTKK